MPSGSLEIKSIYEPSNRRFNIVLLASGLGTRVRSRIGEMPKALLELNGTRAIDLLIKKYRFIADRVIISTGYHAELIEYYVKGKYPELDIRFSREDVRELRGPGRSLLKALDHASSFLPTLTGFCDILIADDFDVSRDALLLCNPQLVSSGSVVGDYSNVAVLEDGIVTDLVPASRVRSNRNGFTGTAVIHNTMLFKKVCYEAALGGRDEYTLDFMRAYVRQARVNGRYVRDIFEFGTVETLTALVGERRGRREAVAH